MKSYYYTKNPINMVFTDKNNEDEFYSEINNVTLAELLETNNLYSISTLDRKKISQLITEQNDTYINEEFAVDFNFYPLDAFKDTNKDDLMTDIAYNPKSLSTAFATAYDDESYNRHYDTLPSFSERSKVRDILVQAIEKGVNTEMLKLHLAKILNKQTEDIKKNGKNSAYFKEIIRTENLLAHAEEITKNFSPYERVFKMGEAMSQLKAKLKNLSEEGQEKAQDKLAYMKTEFDKECAKFDPEMLQDVANYRKQYYMEIDKNMALYKGTKYDLGTTVRTPAYQSTNIVGLYAKSALERQERTTKN